MKIRLAKKTDLEGIKSLLDEQHIFHEKLSPKIFKFHPMDKNEIIEIIVSDEKDFIIAEKTNRVIGLIQIEQKNTGDNPIFVKKDYVYIQEMFIKESHRRKGLGLKLMKEAKEWAKKNDINILRTSVVPNNYQAISFYEKEGFTSFMESLELEI